LKEKEYALYKGEEIIAIGTIDEIAEKTNVDRKTIMFYKTDSYKKRLNRRKNTKRNYRVLVEIQIGVDLGGE
jgi:hypothetical protein